MLTKDYRKVSRGGLPPADLPFSLCYHANITA